MWPGKKTFKYGQNTKIGMLRLKTKCKTDNRTEYTETLIVDL